MRPLELFLMAGVVDALNDEPLRIHALVQHLAERRADQYGWWRDKNVKPLAERFGG